jgi:predicted ATPase
MSKIRIKNFGPIKKGFQENDGWMDVKKVTVFVGNQGSGKSTIAKLISVFTWIEKALTRGDYKSKNFTDYNRFRKNYCAYHRIENYFFDIEGKDQAEIEYWGESFIFRYKNGNLKIEKNREKVKYQLPQIMYVPAERNFISNVKSPKALKMTSDSLVEFVTEFDNAKNTMKGAMKLPVNEVNLEYQKLNDILYIKGKDYQIQLKEASSGFQSLVPLYIVSWYLANSINPHFETTKSMSSEELEWFKKGVKEIFNNKSLTEDQRRVALSVLSSRFNKSAFINIVEEPEQNLFPNSQRQMLYSLLEFNNMNEGNKLIMTTHSPYFINYLTLAVKAEMVASNINSEDSLNKIAKIVPLESTVKVDDLVIYELNEIDGTIKKLETYKGLPSDENELNSKLEDSNELFAQLQEIEKGWR